MVVRNIIFFLFALASCKGSSQQLVTPKAFLNVVKVDAVLYSKDSADILAELYISMKKREPFFQNPEYSDATVLMIDTVMYDASFNKIAVFVIARNPTSSNPRSDSKMPFYYNAGCFLGKRKYVDSSLFTLQRLGPFSLVNFDDLQEVRQAIRDSYFLELATVLDEKGESVFKYNLDDKRFWESPTGWRRMFK